MEQRLGEARTEQKALGVGREPSVARPVFVVPARADSGASQPAALASSGPAVEKLEQTVTPGEDEAPWPTDEAGEAAFLAAARENGETVVPVAPPTLAAPAAEEESKAALPALDSLVQRIPADVRETLEELFRAKFTTVRRVPAKALESR